MNSSIKRFLMCCALSVSLLNAFITNVSAETSGKREVLKPHIFYSEKVANTLYDTFTEKEINMIEVTVQHEAGELSGEFKKLIAEIIYNRLVSDEFPEDIESVLFQSGQFSGINQWYTPLYGVDGETKAVVKEVFSGNETDHDALYYYNPALSDYRSIIWFENSGDVEFLFEYSETGWNNTEYKTRFFK